MKLQFKTTYVAVRAALAAAVLFYAATTRAQSGTWMNLVSGSDTNYFGESANSSPVSVRAVSLTPPQLAIAPANGDQLQFTWPAANTGLRLEAQTNASTQGLGTTWFTVSGSNASNSISQPINSANGSVFFRMSYP